MRSAILFFIAILTPCAVLGWVSWRSMKDEARVIQGQRTALYQQSADNAARSAAAFMTGQLRAFGETVDQLLAERPPEEVRRRFHQTLRSAWPLAEAGLVLETETGRIVAQVEPSEQQVTAFVAAHDWFFSGSPQPLYLELPVRDSPAPAGRSAKELARADAAPEAPALENALAALATEPAAEKPAPAAAPALRSLPAAASGSIAPPLAKMEPAPATDAAVPEPAPPAAPSRQEDRAAAAPDNVQTVSTSLTRLVPRYDTGIAAQIHGGKWFAVFWHRPPDAPQHTFAAAIDATALRAALAANRAFAAPDGDTCLALLDHTQQPAAQWGGKPENDADAWTQPLVARGIGNPLPDWQATVFLRDPAVFTNAASGARWRLGIIVVTASLAAVAGAFFIWRDARKAARDARLKTDFVSNVSHELKTPLTSIRMFSDLLGSQTEAPPEKTRRYAEVIAGEAARLTRLINNVLNFSRMENGTQELKPAALDLCALTAGTVEHMRPQLEKEGFTLTVELPESPAAFVGDADALSQVLLNLLSNAAKYGAIADQPREITVSLTAAAGEWLWSVSDRGPGVPRGHERRIFEKFHRAHDTLSSGTAGSGLGLTIAQRLVEAHGGRLEYSHREGGGAVFTVRLPLGAAAA
jgi:signal transduction histidine kinase